MDKWDSTYRSKIKKGYKDKTELVAERIENADYAPIKNKSVASLIKKLQKFANKTVEDNYKMVNITQQMLDEAEQLIDELSKKNNVYAFNNALTEIFATIPRKMKKVQDYLATSNNDFPEIIKREQDLLDVLATQITTQNKKVSNNNKTILEAFNLEITEHDDELEKKVKSMLGEISDKYINCWYVKNEKTQERYDKHLASQKGIHKTEELFWHGSRNENWMSILTKGMMIRPTGAVYTGSMFGDGIYMANKARKSYGYTSSSNARWTNGNAKTVYMAIFSANVGKYHNVYSHTSECYSFSKDYLQKKGNYDSVFAHAGKSLYNDEIIVYDKEQVTIHAIVELKG
jgi:poly [ADP-ribose] polymerase